MDSRIEGSVPLLSSSQDDKEDDYEERAIHASVLSHKRFRLRYPFLLFASLLISNILTFNFTNWSRTKSLDSLCASHTSQSWTPVFEDVDIKYTTITFNGTLFKDTIYRQPPSPEVDQAWHDLGIECLLIHFPKRFSVPVDKV